MKKTQAWERAYKWGGFRVTPVRTGHKVETWSNVKGCHTGLVTLVPYAASGFSRETDLEANMTHAGFETYISIGEHIAVLSTGGYGRVLRKGEKRKGDTVSSRPQPLKRI